jgi:exosortase B
MNSSALKLKKNTIELLPLLFGFLALYLPSYISLLNGLWRSSDQAHGPIVLMVVIYLFWQKKELLFKSKPNDLINDSSNPFMGFLILFLGLLSYTIGRSQGIIILDLGSQIPVIIGLILIFRGWKTLISCWFPLFFIIFLLPLPLDPITMPMKMAVSYVTETILFWVGYPIARNGVILQIGQYQLLVADACAGMHTLISLEALGLLYLNLVKHDSVTRNIMLATLIIPISFTANVIRVIALTLITYYFGDEIGQGFVHGFAGMLLFVVALTIIMGVDNLIQYFVPKNKRTLK